MWSRDFFLLSLHYSSALTVDGFIEASLRSKGPFHPPNHCMILGGSRNCTFQSIINSLSQCKGEGRVPLKKRRLLSHLLSSPLFMWRGSIPILSVWLVFAWPLISWQLIWLLLVQRPLIASLAIRLRRHFCFGSSQFPGLRLILFWCEEVVGLIDLGITLVLIVDECQSGPKAGVWSEGGVGGTVWDIPWSLKLFPRSIFARSIKSKVESSNSWLISKVRSGLTLLFLCQVTWLAAVGV